MKKYNSGQELRDSILKQLKLVDSATAPAFLSWHTASLKERLLLLRCLIFYDLQHIQVQHFLELLTPLNLGEVPNDDERKELYYSVLHLHSALLVNMMGVQRYIFG